MDTLRGMIVIKYTYWRGIAALALVCAVNIGGALADTVEIPGPSGPLQGAALTVEDARHAVILIPGSGPTDRDGNSPATGMRSDVLRLLAEGLAEAGIASIRIDKRGFFGSASAIADPNAVTIQAYADDARGWIERARDLAPCVWLAGHSEGGLVSLVAAQDPPDGLCGLILLATPGRPVGRLLIEQVGRNAAAAPFLDELTAIVTALEAGTPTPTDRISPPLQGLFAEGTQRYMIDLFGWQPAALAADWDGPALIVQGGADIQVSTEDARLLAEAMPQAERLHLPGATHMLKPDQPGDPIATYREPGLPLDPGLVPGIAGFVAMHGQ